MTDKERQELAQLRADLATLARAVAPHVNRGAELQEIIERNAPDGLETRPHRAPEQRAKAVA